MKILFFFWFQKFQTSLANFLRNFFPKLQGGKIALFGRMVKGKKLNSELFPIIWQNLE